MKAVILAAGKGTRMRDLTQEMPKPMLRVLGKPILQHIVDGLFSAGIREICIITGWRADVIEQHFGDGAPYGVHITYARQEIQDGTGRAPEYAKAFVGPDDFLLTYGDILVKPETYGRMVRRFRGTDDVQVLNPDRDPEPRSIPSDGTPGSTAGGTPRPTRAGSRGGPFDGVITVTVGEDVSKGGLNFFDTDFCLTRLVEKPSPDQIAALRSEGLLREGQPLYYNAGIYIFRPSLYEFTARLEKSPRGEYELTDAISMMIQSGHRLAGLEIEGRWVDVRDPEVLQRLERGEA